MEEIAILRWILLLLPVASWAYYVLVICSARSFSRATLPPHPGFTPPVSILKPVRGLDPEAYENFASFCRLDYPEYELLFCVNEEADPAVPFIRRVIADFPQRRIRLLIGAAEIGPHSKVNKLARMACEASHDILLTSDGDVRAHPSLLRSLVAPLAEKNVAAVTCLYRTRAAESFGTTLEVLGITTEFFPGVMAAWRLGGIKFTFGHTAAIKREKLAEIGGFEQLADCYAEDYELGARLAARGYTVLLSPELPEIVFPAISVAGFFRRQLRSNLAIRSGRPWGYAGILFTHGLPLAVAASLVGPNVAMVIGYFGFYVAFRFACAWRIGIRLVGDPLTRRKFWLVPLYDAFAFLAWLAGFFTRRVNWRGTTYEVRRGRMRRV